MNKLNPLTSFTQVEFEFLLKEFSKQVDDKILHFTLKGKRRSYPKFKESKLSSLHGSSKKLEFILIYIKEYPNLHFMASHFQMSQSKVSEWIAFLLPVLFHSLKKCSLVFHSNESFEIPENLDNILCDVTERQITRSIDNDVQKEYYSVKKKSHT
ncbi:transposase family protein [Flammeovirga aprica JL-4]|uniref:Transposase family protein n=1 Tax=Flammeovirga aprica JL-4 TaxID=694437 RepID=A0A7X9RY56_9BACT|nr:transposase family protein [Flammeovirga aprica JL-4]